MKLQPFSRPSSLPKTLNTNLSHPTSTNTMPLSTPFEPSRTISLQVWPPLTQIFLSPTGVSSCPKRNSPSIYFAPPGSTPNSLPTHNLKESNFNKTPRAPQGTHVIVHEKPSQCRTWAPHGINIWYVGPALDRYQCHHIWIPSTQSERIANTLRFFPTVL